MCFDLAEFGINNRLEERIANFGSYGGLDDIFHCIKFSNCNRTYEWAVELQNDVSTLLAVILPMYLIKRHPLDRIDITKRRLLHILIT